MNDGKVDWAGNFPAVVSPFTRDGEIDEEKFTRNIEILVSEGVDGVVVSGSNGESWALKPNERLRLFRLARDAALVPNAVKPGHFEALREHFNDTEIVELVAVISLFGFLNRWNDTMATALEAEPLAFAERELAPGGWRAGKHASRGS